MRALLLVATGSGGKTCSTSTLKEGAELVVCRGFDDVVSGRSERRGPVRLRRMTTPIV